MSDENNSTVIAAQPTNVASDSSKEIENKDSQSNGCNAGCASCGDCSCPSFLESLLICHCLGGGQEISCDGCDCSGCDCVGCDVCGCSII